MDRQQAATKRRRIALGLATVGIASGIVVWQLAPRQLAYATDFAEQWISGAPIGEIYTHSPDEFPYPQLGDVPQDVESPDEYIDPRSLGDTRVRQFDELDRPRFNDRETHRGAQVNEERFSVVAMTGEEDAQLAKEEFGKAWDEFSKLADTFTDAHRNPDFGISQLLIVVDNEPIRERDEPKRTLQLQNGQTIVYINAAPGEPSLSEQLPELWQGAVHAMLHLAELDRKFPLWAQQGLAEYTAEKIKQREQSEAVAEEATEAEGYEPSEFSRDETVGDEYTREQFDDEQADGVASVAMSNEVSEEDTTGAAPVDVEYWRLQRAEPDRLDESLADEESESVAALERVTFLLEGDDATHAPQFLLGLRALAQEATDPLLASRAELADTQLLPPASDTIIDELFDELQPDFVAWKADPMRGQPLFLPAGEMTDPAMLRREKEMEIVLKLALRNEQVTSTTDIRPRVMEFGAEGQQEVTGTTVIGTAINVEQLYHLLVDAEAPWATTDAAGSLLLWTQEDELAQVLGIDDDRYSSEYRDGRWILVTNFDESTQLEAWLEPNQDNPSRPLVKFAAREREASVRVVELDARSKVR